MASYSLQFRPSVEKDLRALPKSVTKRIWRRVEALADEPIPAGSVKLSGAEALYRIRVGDYRVIYGIDHSSKRILVHYIRHRKDAYRNL